MIRQPMTVVAVLSMALLTYVAFVVLIAQRINSWISVTLATPARPPLVSNGWVNLFGVSVRYELLIIIGSIMPTWWITTTLFGIVRRRTREKIGLCLKCGHSLPGKRGRCPGCGARYERVGPGEPRFPVKLLRT